MFLTSPFCCPLHTGAAACTELTTMSRGMHLAAWYPTLMSLQADLVKDGGHLYFLRYLEAADAGPPDSRAQAAFVLAVLCRPGGRGQVLSRTCPWLGSGPLLRSRCFLRSCVRQCPA